jgi:hypothetical protein
MSRWMLGAATALGLFLALPGAAFAGPGLTINEQCGASFGGLVSAAKSAGTAAHANYPGGARAFSHPAILAAHGCGA